jgi:hypothetical protein
MALSSATPMMLVKNIATRFGDDVGYHNSNMYTPDGEGRKGKHGFDKTLSWEKMLELALKIGANIIVKAGPNAKWYLKCFPAEAIDDEVKKQAWRRTDRATMWVITTI